MNNLLFGYYINPKLFEQDHKLPMLKIGVNSHYVELLQHLLRFVVGYNGPFSGVFDHNTEQYVRHFEQQHNLPSNGMVDEAVWKAFIPYITSFNDEISNFSHSDLEVYTVLYGDTLYSIAHRYHTTVDQISQLNRLTSAVIEPGMRLALPHQLSETESFSTEKQYQVQPGDSLYAIARRFNITVQQLMIANHLTTDMIYPGQVLFIPGGEGMPIFYQHEHSHTVMPGDTLYSIANYYHTTVDELKALNQLNSDLITIGTMLQLP